MTIRATLTCLVLAVAPFIGEAHSPTERTTPADGATVAAVSELRVAFGGPMRITFAALTHEGTPLAITRDGGLDPVTELRATPDAALAPGGYRFEWRGLAADGHPMTGEFGFTVSE